MPKHYSRLLCAAALLALPLAGCDQADVTPTTPAPDPLLARLAEMGFPLDLVEDRGSHFMIDGDIIVRKDALRQAPEQPSAAPPGPRQQYHTNTRVGDLYEIRVDLSAIDAERADWATAVRSAMQQWNAIPGAKIRLIEGSPADITVIWGTCDNSTTAVACAEFPYLTGSWPWQTGAPGHTVEITRGYHHYSASLKLFTVAHEFGHTLGFRHTNWANRPCPNGSGTCSESVGPHGAVQIPGTPSSATGDAGSVMNASVNYWAGFSYYDRVAARYLFPGGPGPSASGAAESGGVRVNWSSMQDAVSYEVYWYQTEACPDVFCWYPPAATETKLGTTTGTTFLDTTRSQYPFCGWNPQTGYGVRAVFADGSKSGLGALACQAFTY